MIFGLQGGPDFLKITGSTPPPSPPTSDETTLHFESSRLVRYHVICVSVITCSVQFTEGQRRPIAVSSWRHKKGRRGVSSNDSQTSEHRYPVAILDFHKEKSLGRRLQINCSKCTSNILFTFKKFFPGNLAVFVRVQGLQSYHSVSFVNRHQRFLGPVKKLLFRRFVVFIFIWTWYNCPVTRPNKLWKWEQCDRNTSPYSSITCRCSLGRDYWHSWEHWKLVLSLKEQSNCTGELENSVYKVIRQTNNETNELRWMV